MPLRTDSHGSKLKDPQSALRLTMNDPRVCGTGVQDGKFDGQSAQSPAAFRVAEWTVHVCAAR